MAQKTDGDEEIKKQVEESKVHEKEQEPEKPLRRIAQRGEMPSDKSQLIQYLSDRIKQAEDALADTEELLDQEVKEREKVQKSLDDRNVQLSKLYEVDQRALPEKIKEKLNQILTTTVTQKIEAEEILGEEKSRNYEYRSRYDEIKWEDANNKAKLEEQESKEQKLTGQIEQIQTQNATCQNELEELNNEYNDLKDKKESLENQYLQMKVALERMGDIRGVLNRFFNNEDLFDDGMNLKEQKVTLPVFPQKQTSLPPSRTNSRQTNTQKLKPISRIKNDDDDFWRADFKGKNSAY